MTLGITGSLCTRYLVSQYTNTNVSRAQGLVYNIVDLLISTIARNLLISDWISDKSDIRAPLFASHLMGSLAGATVTALICSPIDLQAAIAFSVCSLAIQIILDYASREQTRSPTRGHGF